MHRLRVAVPLSVKWHGRRAMMFAHYYFRSTHIKFSLLFGVQHYMRERMHPLHNSPARQMITANKTAVIGAGMGRGELVYALMHNDASECK